ncbi:helix-turn-helix transcriptional regulator [Streptomyces lycii]|uniref:Helix-turn-helix transcriptional regulator n=1 Tax=Streptomyces lycii TaxID=2654337 RepID=A0ABQ7FKU5_9ACTN|nr:helix-turn-helix transcriptional regulator [Streptomyces lycii]KAF4408598.1 helix-turn-helix transcriptional regulator [Streptomyces lycii]
MYAERPSARAGAVVWTLTADGGPKRVLPDGCMDIIWDGGGLLVAGPDTRAQLPVTRPGTRLGAVRLLPGNGPRVLGVPARELRDRRVELAALWPGGQVRRLAERLYEAADPAAVLEELAAERLRAAGPADPWVTAVVAGLRAGRAVSAVAGETGLGARQLHRRALAAFGYGPKTLARVLRMNRALDLARAGRPLAEVAVRAGFADQAHLSRDVKALAGVAPGALLHPPAG